MMSPDYRQAYEAVGRILRSELGLPDDCPDVLPAIRALKAERDALKAENARLSEELGESQDNLRSAEKELMDLANEKPRDISVFDESGREYIIRWDNGDESAGIHAGWVSEDLDDVVAERDMLRDALKWLVGTVEIELQLDAAGIPHHDCGYRNSPETGYCEFHEKWADCVELRRRADAAKGGKG